MHASCPPPSSPFAPPTHASLTPLGHVPLAWHRLGQHCLAVPGPRSRILPTPLPNAPSTSRAARATPQAPNKLSRPRIFFLPFLLAPRCPLTRRQCPASGVTLPSPARQQWFQTCGNNAHLSFSCHSTLPETRSERYPGT